MNIKHSTEARKQLDRRLAPLRDMALVAPHKGWIKAIRESLGMTARQLAVRMGVSPSRIPTNEKAESSGATTVRTLRHVAAAMDCAFVYAFVPIEPLDATVRKRAQRRAREDVARLDHTMRLEGQALVASDLAADEQRAVDRILSGSLRGLWEMERGRDA